MLAVTTKKDESWRSKGIQTFRVLVEILHASATAPLSAAATGTAQSSYSRGGLPSSRLWGGWRRDGRPLCSTGELAATAPAYGELMVGAPEREVSRDDREVRQRTICATKRHPRLVQSMRPAGVRSMDVRGHPRLHSCPPANLVSAKHLRSRPLWARCSDHGRQQRLPAGARQ